LKESTLGNFIMASHLTSNSSPQETPTPTHDILDVQTTNCCIVGGGPAGAVLALMLVRQDISVILLEAHKDFDRDFRGDTIHPSVMEIMEELGLAEKLLQLPLKSVVTATWLVTLRLPWLRDLPARLVAYGVFPAHVKT
jgi:NADPH-dependent 2,4-dienoyl-CoA reductase/sulfur reductase-like enzyme